MISYSIYSKYALQKSTICSIKLGIFITIVIKWTCTSLQMIFYVAKTTCRCMNFQALGLYQILYLVIITQLLQLGVLIKVQVNV